MAAKLHKHPIRSREFPALTHLNHKVTSPVDLKYNCVAWAMEDSNRWWWPDGMGINYWPPHSRREVSIAAFEEMLAHLGYTPCVKRTVESGLQKVALFVKGGVPVHLAKQAQNGKWSSKLGQVEDIEHTSEALNGPEYGTIHRIFARPRK